MYADNFSKVYGIDVVDYSRYHPNVDFRISDGFRTNIESGSIDLVVSHSVLEHVGDLDECLNEIDRMAKVGGYLYLTVDPLYFSSYGSHVNVEGRRLDQWQHLDPASTYYMTRSPLPQAKTSGHDLNMLTSSVFLAAVGKQPWNILRYEIGFERKSLPNYVDVGAASALDLMMKSFRFVGQKIKDHQSLMVSG